MKNLGIIRILYHAGKFLLSILVLSVFVFTISRLAPGDPLYAYYGERLEKMGTAEQEQARARLGLDEPIPVQYARWLQGRFAAISASPISIRRM